MTPNQIILERIRRNALPAVATLHDARIVPLASGNFALKGHAHYDPTLRFADGTLITTTGVQSLHIDPVSLLPVFRTQSGSYYHVVTWRPVRAA